MALPVDPLTALLPPGPSLPGGALDGGALRPGGPGGAAGSPAPGSPEAERAAREFEAYMVTFLAQQLRASMPDGPMSSGPMATFAGLFDQEIGRRVAESGGLGLRDQLERALATAGLPAGSLPGHPGGGHPAPHPPRPADPSPADRALGRVTSGFGTRSDPFDHAPRRHQGIDLGRPEGSPVRAVADGTVRFAGARGGYGNLVIVQHADGTETRYAHCAELRVRAGEAVPAGGEIATVGHTGRATGPHLHFEVRQDGVAVDPAAWLRRTGAPEP